MNEYDTNRIYDIVKKINYKKTKILNEADCYVLNTCHIREKATDKVYHDIGKNKKNFKNKKTNSYCFWLRCSSRGRDPAEKREIYRCGDRPSIIPPIYRNFN